VPSWFRIWWGAWIAGCIASTVTNWLRDAENFGAPMAAEWANLVASLVLAIAGVAAARVVHDTHARLQARRSRTEDHAKTFGFFPEPQA
jgi:fluoride ion exporter CrcB/FEX